MVAFLAKTELDPAKKMHWHVLSHTTARAGSLCSFDGRRRCADCPARRHGSAASTIDMPAQVGNNQIGGDRQNREDW